MGSPRTENGRFDSEGPLHEVAIKAFALGKYDVTSEEFLTFLRETGYQPPPCNSILEPERRRCQKQTSDRRLAILGFQT